MVLRRLEQLPLTRCELGHMFIYAVDARILRKQFRRPDRSYPLHAGDIVGRIAAERQNVDHLGRRGNLPFFADFLHSENLVVGSRLPGPVLPDMRRDELSVVLVRSDHVDIQTFAGEADGGRTYDVVGLVSGNHQHGDVHGPDYLRQRFERVDDQLGRLRAVGLVLRVQSVAEGASGRIEAHGQVGRLLPVDQFQQIFGEAEEYRGVDTARIHDVSAEEGVIHLEDQRVSVNQEKFHPYRILELANMKLFSEVS